MASKRKYSGETAPSKGKRGELLMDVNPELYNQLHPTLNEGIDLEKLTKASRSKVWWICKAHNSCQKHVWCCVVAGRSRGSGCPFCDNKKKCGCPAGPSIKKGVELFKDKFPHLVCEIIPKLNPGIDLSKLSRGSGKEVVWTCRLSTCCTHTWTSKVSARVRGGCPFCSGKSTCKCRSLLTLFPEVAKQVDLSKHPGIDLSTVNPGSNSELNWVCNNPDVHCTHHRWSCVINARTIYSTGCPYCSTRNVCPCSSVSSKSPWLLSFFDYDKNTLKPTELSNNSIYLVHWKCSGKNSKGEVHHWEASVVSMSRRESHDCFDCDTFKLKYPELFLYLDPVQDDNIDINTLPCNGRTEARWICPTHKGCDMHRWKATTTMMIGREVKCQFCTGRMACHCNSLLAKYPAICEELIISAKDPIDPDTTPVNSKIRTNWKCKKCDHQWSSTICNRTRNLSGCPKCNRSALETQCAIILDKLKISYEIEKRFDDCKSVNCLPFDFYLPELNFLTELDGAQHFKAFDFGNGMSDLDAQMERDRIKTEYARTKGINFLRISFSEIKNMEKLITTFLDDLKVSTTRLERFCGKEYSIV